MGPVNETLKSLQSQQPPPEINCSVSLGQKGQFFLLEGDCQVRSHTTSCTFQNPLACTAASLSQNAWYPMRQLDNKDKLRVPSLHDIQSHFCLGSDSWPHSCLWPQSYPLDLMFRWECSRPKQSPSSKPEAQNYSSSCLSSVYLSKASVGIPLNQTLRQRSG